jgi:hypothetical protein
MFLRFGLHVRLPLSHGPITSKETRVFPSAVNGREAPLGRFVRATRCDAHRKFAGCGQREPLLFAYSAFRLQMEGFTEPPAAATHHRS